ncbi:MAG TPA: DmsC/YnfH family molybdoenzyme membrane anchor subunit [Pirellulales bacterium]|nr:DmsC/YnfH family molybdoenzyme membrane anchor subunit [Pirellulales bacterium]
MANTLNVSTSAVIRESKPPAIHRVSPPRDASALVASLLAEQHDLSAVERFSQRHATSDEPSQAKYYRSLLPASPPGPGQQYAFEVDLDRCSGCKSCVTACHTLNGLDEHETWREVGLLHGGTPELPILQHATTACHHCLDPACMTACPVRAYEKHPETGIVKHLDDQCIGCQYCVFACPYDVPKYNPRRGIVRKCDMCSERLAVGEAPACVQACPHEAIRITVAGQQDVIANCETNSFLPGAPEPTITFPTTNYKTARALPRNLLPADYYSVKREHAHWPLIVMLVLTQLSVGAFLVELAMRRVPGSGVLAALRPIHSTSALLFGLLALAASVLHLGRPRYAFRAILGLRTSWLSREILAFGLFAAAAVVYAASTWWSNASVASAGDTLLAFAVVGLGLAGVFCSVMVYAVTRRAFWNAAATSAKFLLTMSTLGAATALSTSYINAASIEAIRGGALMADYGRQVCVVLTASMAVKLLVEASIFRHVRQKQASPLRRSALLMLGELAAVTKSRFICGFVGGIALPGLLLQIGAPPSGQPGDLFTGLVASTLFVACLAGELLERYLFFAAVAQPKMPGGVGG